MAVNQPKSPRSRCPRRAAWTFPGPLCLPRIRTSRPKNDRDFAQTSDPIEWYSSNYMAEMLGHLLAILMTRYAHYIPATHDEPLGFASLASAARVMDDNLTPIPTDLRDLKREKS